MAKQGGTADSLFVLDRTVLSGIFYFLHRKKEAGKGEKMYILKERWRA